MLQPGLLETHSEHATEERAECGPRTLETGTWRATHEAHPWCASRHFGGTQHPNRALSPIQPESGILRPREGDPHHGAHLCIAHCMRLAASCSLGGGRSAAVKTAHYSLACW